MFESPNTLSRGTGAQYSVLPESCFEQPAIHELEIKRSRFIGAVLRVTDEAQARDFIAQQRRRHPDARHACSAMILGHDRSVMRSSDDGEPAGTAGMPMAEALRQREIPQQAGADGDEAAPRRDLSDICAVVVRYFGGIKLGAGGLVRAYSEAVSSTLDTVDLLTRRRMLIMGIPSSHAEAGRWENDLRSAGFRIQYTDYSGPEAQIQLAIDDSALALERLESHLAQLSGGTREAVQLYTEWTDLT